MILFSDSTSLYFYSALLQGNAALVTLVAMLLVYRKQYLDSVFDRIEKIMINHLQSTAKVTANFGDIFDFEKYDEKYVQNLSNETKIKLKKVLENSSWASRFEELKNVASRRNTLWSGALPSIRLIFIILGASIIMLPLSDQIHGFVRLEAIFFVVYVIAEILALVSLFKFIRGQFV